LQERGCTTGLTVKVTRSAGVLFLAESGFFGCLIAVTEVTFTTGFDDPPGAREESGVAGGPEAAGTLEVLAVDFGAVLQPASDAPTHTAAARTSDARIIQQS